MKVWERCNEVKGTNADVMKIAAWAWSNRICPLEFDEELEADLPRDNGFVRTARKICDGNCGRGCLMNYLNSEYEEDEHER